MKTALIAAALTGATSITAFANDADVANLPLAKSLAVSVDKTAPKIISFRVPTLVKTTTVPITSFVATDDTALAGYMITLSSSVPLPTAKGWSPTSPTSFLATGNGLQTLYAWAKDKAGNVSLPTTAKVTIDTSAPTVTAFSVPSQVNSLNIPVTTLSATDNTAVTGYLITETATVPGLTAPWQATQPASYVATQAGVKTLYAWARDGAGNVSKAKTVKSTVDTTQPSGQGFNLAQTLSDQAQSTTLAFDGLALITGNLDAQSFFPPGKVADYTGFQYLRDNDPDNMGHNTSFLTRIANNVINILNNDQMAQLVTLATAQQQQVDLYGYKRFPLMQAFRRLINGNIPAGSTSLNLNAVKQASRELYLLDGQISFDRALLYANILNSLDATQTARLAAMKGKGFNSWPNIINDQISSKMKALPQGSAVAVMTYASDLFSWYAGSVEADVYFCPERHGTYYGGFYIKDAPAVGHEGYSISEQLTATAGAALSDSSKGYVTKDQATLMSSLVDTQRNNLYASPTTNIVKVRTEIATLLRGLLKSTASADEVKSQVLALSNTYGNLDGENNYAYAAVFAKVYQTLDASQKTNLAGLRRSIMSGTYANGTAFDYSVATTPFLYSQVITNLGFLAPYISNTDYLFFEP